MTIEDLIKKNEQQLQFLKRGSEPEIKNYSYYQGKQDAYNEVLDEMIKIYKKKNGSRSQGRE